MSLFVKVAFPTGRQLYTYRTHHHLEPKDYVVVPTPQGFSVARVHSVHQEEEINMNVPYEYNRIVQQVDFSDYKELTAKDKSGKGRL